MINSYGARDHRNEQRKDPRVVSELPASISVGSQLTVQGVLKDLSLKSAFIKIKNNIFLKSSDEIGFTIQCSENVNDVIQGLARVSRVAVGEGLVIYFIKMDEASLVRLKKHLQKSGA